MTLKSLRFTPSAVVSFSENDLRLMMECSARHYDGRCKSISSPGQGSFLYGWTHRFGDSTEAVHPYEEGEETVSLDQLDTLMKVVEVARYLPDEADQKEAFGLGLKLRIIFFRVQEGYNLEPAIAKAREALRGDSNDAEHDALVSLMAALGETIPEGN